MAEKEVNMKTDTIAAISTPLNSSGIGIVRMSGDDAVMIADKVFRKKGNKCQIRSWN